MIHIILGIYVDNIPNFFLSHIGYTNSNLYHLCYIYTVFFYIFILCYILGSICFRFCSKLKHREDIRGESSKQRGEFSKQRGEFSISEVSFLLNSYMFSTFF
jgi:hypothetical protein